MNFTNLEHFYELSKSESIRTTAAGLMVSQQALSAEIQRLEKELDVELLTRTRPAAMTACGKRFAEFAGEVLLMRQQLDRDLAELSGQKREILISIPPSGCPPFLSDAITRFVSVEQNCHIRLEERAENASRNDIRKYDFNLSDRHISSDMEYIQIQSKNVGAAPIQLEDKTKSNYFSVVARKELFQRIWGEAWKQRLQLLEETEDFSLLRDVPFIRTENAFEDMDMYFREVGFTPKIVASTNNTDTGFTLCLAGVGAQIAPDGWVLWKSGNSCDLDALVILRLSRVCPAPDIYLSYEQGKVLSAQEQQFIRCLFDACQLPGTEREQV